MAQLEEIEDEEAPSRIIAQQRALAQEADAFAAAPPRTNPSGAAPFDFKAGNGKGFFENLIASIFEPGVNRSLFQAMNISFFLLIIVLSILFCLTGYNKHVAFLTVVSCGLWGSMVWFVIEITKVQHSPQNAPPSSSNTGSGAKDGIEVDDFGLPDDLGKKDR